MSADHLTEVRNEIQLKEALTECRSLELKPLILGGGSNVLFSSRQIPYVILIKIKGIQVISETPRHVIVEAGAGENWHEFVMHCISKNWGGVENLSLIPGSVGAGPMQNIGAYGVELKDVFHSLDAIERKTLETRTFSAMGCKFGYRESIFKKELRNKYVITKVRLRLTKTGHHELNMSYGAITQELLALGVAEPTIESISNAVVNIRRSKLPDPTVLGNAGSFFKNPVVEATIAANIKNQFPEIPIYPSGDTELNTVKLAAGWLIEQAGWKGKRVGNCGMHAQQALVLVNYGGATGEELLLLAESIQKDVQQKFGVTLEREVNVV